MRRGIIGQGCRASEEQSKAAGGNAGHSALFRLLYILRALECHQPSPPCAAKCAQLCIPPVGGSHPLTTRLSFTVHGTKVDVRVLTVFSYFLYSPCSGIWGLADPGGSPLPGLASAYR